MRKKIGQIFFFGMSRDEMLVPFQNSQPTTTFKVFKVFIYADTKNRMISCIISYHTVSCNIPD